MSLRGLAVLLITIFGLGSSFYNAFYGLIVYAFWSYSYPEQLCYGLLPSNMSAIMAVTLIFNAIVQKKKLLVKDKTYIAFFLFWALCAISVLSTGAGAYHLQKLEYFTKILIITIVIMLLVDDLKKFRYYLWAIAVFIGVLAAQSGLKGIIFGYVGGDTQGFEGTIGNRNYMAIMLCVTIPIVFFLGRTERRPILRSFIWITLIGDIFALIITYSRGGFIGIAAICIMALSEFKRKIFTLFATGIILLIALNTFIPSAYIERIGTILNFDPDEYGHTSSAPSRLILWRSAIEMIKHNPITGVGFYRSEKQMEYYPDPRTGVDFPDKPIHNSLLQVGSELGLPALLIYIAIFFASYRSLEKIKKRAAGSGPENEVRNYAFMLQLCFVGFFASGFFANAAFMDICWHLVGLTVALRIISDKIAEEKGSYAGYNDVSNERLPAGPKGL